MSAAPQARICTWVDLSLTDVEHLLRASEATESLQQALGEILVLGDPATSSKQAVIELDLYTYAILFARKQKFSADQVSAFFTILKCVHCMCISTPFNNFEETFQYFKELLLRHGVSRPPYSTCLFSIPQVKAVSEYVLNTYFKHFKLYKYAFTKRVHLNLKLSYPGVPDSPELSETEVTGECEGVPMAIEDKLEGEKEKEKEEEGTIASFPGSTPQSRSQAPLPSLVPRLHSPVSFPGSTPQPRSQAPLPSLVPRLHSPALFPGSTSQPCSQAPLPSLVPRLHSPVSFSGSTSQLRSRAPLPSLVPRLHSPASFPGSTPQSRSQAPLPSFVPGLHSPASFPGSTLQPRSQAPLPSLVPRLHSPALFPGSTSQPCSQAPLPSLVPRLHFPASFPGSTPQPRSQAPLSSLVPRLHSPGFVKGPGNKAITIWCTRWASINEV